MGRAPCCEDRQGLKKGAWTAEEDKKLVSFIEKNKGHGSWRTLPKLAGLDRCGKSCRLRWTNYLRPNIKRGNFSDDEERIIIQLHAFMGNKWSSIASQLPGRTDNEVKNHWNTHLKKRLSKMGIDPTTHLPLQSLMPHCQDAANYYRLLGHHYQSDEWRRALLQRALQLDPAITCHLVQWELARVEAETRMQIAAAAAASSHEYASWLQRLQHNQALSYAWSDHMQAINQQQLQDTQIPSTSMFINANSEPRRPSQYSEAAIDDQFLEQLNPLENEGNHCLASPNCSMETPETCSSESTSHLVVCDQLQLPDLLSSLQEMPAQLINPLSPPSLDDANLPHDSYWNKMLDLLGPAAILEDL